MKNQNGGGKGWEWDQPTWGGRGEPISEIGSIQVFF